MHLRDAAADQRMVDTPSMLAYLPRILAYPVSGHALPALVLFTGLLWIGLQSILGIALLAIVSPWVLHYAEAIIERTAQGQATAPQFGGDMIYIGGLSALRPLVGVALIATLWYALRPAGPAAGAAVLALGAFLFPAFMLVLVTHGRLWAALNPLILAIAIAGVGPAYLLLCALLAGAAAAALYVAGQSGLALALFVGIYTWLLTCHLLGFVAFHRAERLGLPAPVRITSEERALQAQHEARLAGVLAAVDAALARGDLQAAGAALYAEAGTPRMQRQFHEELFQQMERRRKPALIHAQGARLIAVLLAERGLARALEIAEACFDAHADFVPETAQQALMLAEEALRARREGLLERIASAAARRYADRPELQISLAFLRARACYELRRDEAQARALLAPLLGANEHPQHAQIAAYARALAPRPAPTR